MNLNIENLVRSAVVLAVGLPVALGTNQALGVAGRMATLAENAASQVDVRNDKERAVKAELFEPCLKYLVSKADSKLERDAKNAIDETLGGEVNYGAVCKWAM